MPETEDPIWAAVRHGFPVAHTREDGTTWLEWASDEQTSAVVGRHLLEELIADQNVLRHIKRIMSENSVGWALD